MVVKAVCSHCQQPYLGRNCPCQQGRKTPRLECECGKPATAVWVDDFGEWPLCSRCLALEQDEFAPLPIRPTVSDLLQGRGTEFSLQDLIANSDLARCLTRREMQVASLAHLPDEEIGNFLFISTRTVRWHLQNIRRKLGVSERAEILSTLHRSYLTGSQSPQLSWDLLETSPVQGRLLTVKISVPVKQLRRLIRQILLEFEN